MEDRVHLHGVTCQSILDAHFPKAEIFDSNTWKNEFRFLDGNVDFAHVEYYFVIPDVTHLYLLFFISWLSEEYGQGSSLHWRYPSCRICFLWALTLPLPLDKMCARLFWSKGYGRIHLEGRISVSTSLFPCQLLIYMIFKIFMACLPTSPVTSRLWVLSSWDCWRIVQASSIGTWNLSSKIGGTSLSLTKPEVRIIF